jgi:hypothetical protein
VLARPAEEVPNSSRPCQYKRQKRLVCSLRNGVERFRSSAAVLAKQAKPSAPLGAVRAQLELTIIGCCSIFWPALVDTGLVTSTSRRHCHQHVSTSESTSTFFSANWFYSAGFPQVLHAALPTQRKFLNTFVQRKQSTRTNKVSLSPQVEVLGHCLIFDYLAKKHFTH